VSTARRITLHRVSLVAALIAVAIGDMAITTPASAQGLFEALFGAFRRPAPSVPAHTTAYANPAAPIVGDRSNDASRSSPPPAGPSVSYCVRTCDGRYFPLQRQANPVQTCSSLCPASETRVFYGSNIEGARGQNGVRYADLRNAFVYREKIVAGCTCNGRDPFGLARLDLDQDQTMRAGDIVASPEGLMAYRGIDRNNNHAQYTPVSNYSALSAEVRKKLSEMKIDTSSEPENTAAALSVKSTDTSAARAPVDLRAQLLR
jgi:hypothetical protein